MFSRTLWWVLGVAGLVLPIIPALLLILLGVDLLGLLFLLPKSIRAHWQLPKAEGKAKLRRLRLRSGR